MNRRSFLAASVAAATTGQALPLVAQNYSDYSTDPRPDVPEGAWTAGGPDAPVFGGPPVVSGPAPDALTVLQPVQRLATGHLEYALEEGAWQRVDGGHAGLLPLSEHVLRFLLPPLPPGKIVRYRVVARAAGWIKVRQFYHGEFRAGMPQTGREGRFRTLDPHAKSTTFTVWNDTHENVRSLEALHVRTQVLEPDFLVWNGDQSNDIHFEREMAGQFLAPSGLAIADRWPLVYVRGNHDVRGPAARSLPEFTGTPGNRYYYGFRSGPLAAVVLDTGEDKPDDHPQLGGTSAFERLQREQATWLERLVTEAWFRRAPFKVAFCHIPLWFRHPRNPNHRFDGARFCRDLWVPALVRAGVNLIVSGHTHEPAWLPSGERQPIAQIVGGGPQPEHATLIRGTVTRREFRLSMTRLDGSIVADITFPSQGGAATGPTSGS